MTISPQENANDGGRPIALIGGAGFIGTALARHMAREGQAFVIVDLMPSAAFPSQSRIADIQDKNALATALRDVSAVVHLAAEHRDDVRPLSRYTDVNVNGTRNICEICAAQGIETIIFTSSVALYGLDAGTQAGGSRETDPPAPFNAYGQSKWEAEQILQQWAQQNPRRSLAAVRLVATFGPGNRGNIYTLMQQIARGRFVMIGDGRNCKSIAYVENVAAFLAWTLRLGAGSHLYNYADKPDLSTAALVRRIRVALGLTGGGPCLPYALGLAGGYVFDAAARVTRRNFPISVIRVRKFCASTVVNADKARAHGFVAQNTLEQGIDAMIAAEFKTTTPKAA